MVAKTDSLLAPASSINRRWFYVPVIVLGLGLLAFLLFYHLGEYPAPWYDEGSHLHVAKNYALNGQYADFSSEGLRYFGPAVGVGPTVMLPAALLFKIGGVSIPLARLLIVAYAILTLIVFTALARQVSNLWVALLAIALLVLSPGADFITSSRNVIGEIPGLFFMVAGLWLWFRTEKPGVLALVGVGVLFGLACITKNQFALFILPSLLLSWIADLFWYRQRGWRTFVIPGILAGLIFAGWTYIVLIALGAGSLSENMATLRTASSGAFFIFGRAEIERAVRFLVDTSVYGSLFVPAVLYAGYLSLRRTREGQQWGTLVIFTFAATGLFVSSLAWPRYAFAAVAIAAVFVARMLFDLINGLRVQPENPAPAYAARALVAGVLVVTLLMPLVTQSITMLTQGSNDAYVLADYLNTEIPQDAVIETWEQELGVLTDHRYHYPPQVVLAYAVDETWRGGQPAHELYDFRDQTETPEYVVVGSFAKYSNIYPADYLQDYTLIHTQGPFDVYQHRSN